MTKPKGYRPKICNPLIYFGAAGRNRTHDPLVRSPIPKTYRL